MTNSCYCSSDNKADYLFGCDACAAQVLRRNGLQDDVCWSYYGPLPNCCCQTCRRQMDLLLRRRKCINLARESPLACYPRCGSPLGPPPSCDNSCQCTEHGIDVLICTKPQTNRSSGCTGIFFHDCRDNQSPQKMEFTQESKSCSCIKLSTADCMSTSICGERTETYPNSHYDEETYYNQGDGDDVSCEVSRRGTTKLNEFIPNSTRSVRRAVGRCQKSTTESIQVVPCESNNSGSIVSVFKAKYDCMRRVSSRSTCTCDDSVECSINYVEGILRGTSHLKPKSRCCINVSTTPYHFYKKIICTPHHQHRSTCTNEGRICHRPACLKPKHRCVSVHTTPCHNDRKIFCTPFCKRPKFHYPNVGVILHRHACLKPNCRCVYKTVYEDVANSESSISIEKVDKSQPVSNTLSLINSEQIIPTPVSEVIIKDKSFVSEEASSTLSYGYLGHGPWSVSEQVVTPTSSDAYEKTTPSYNWDTSDRYSCKKASSNDFEDEMLALSCESVVDKLSPLEKYINEKTASLGSCESTGSDSDSCHKVDSCVEITPVCKVDVQLKSTILKYVTESTSSDICKKAQFCRPISTVQSVVCSVNETGDEEVDNDQRIKDVCEDSKPCLSVVSSVTKINFGKSENTEEPTFVEKLEQTSTENFICESVVRSISSGEKVENDEESTSVKNIEYSSSKLFICGDDVYEKLTSVSEGIADSSSTSTSTPESVLPSISKTSFEKNGKDEPISVEQFEPSSNANFNCENVDSYVTLTAICETNMDSSSSYICENNKVCSFTSTFESVVCDESKTSGENVANKVETYIEKLELPSSKNVNCQNLNFSSKSITVCECIVDSTSSEMCKNDEQSSHVLKLERSSSEPFKSDNVDVCGVSSYICANDKVYRSASISVSVVCSVSKTSALEVKHDEEQPLSDRLETSSTSNFNCGNLNICEELTAVSECKTDLNSPYICTSAVVFKPTLTSVSKTSTEKVENYEEPLAMKKLECSRNEHFMSEDVDLCEKLTPSSQCIEDYTSLYICENDKAYKPLSTSESVLCILSKTSVKKAEKDDEPLYISCEVKDVFEKLTHKISERVESDEKPPNIAKLERLSSENISCEDVDVYERLTHICKCIIDATSSAISKNAGSKTSEEKIYHHEKLPHVNQLEYSTTQNMSCADFKICEKSTPVCEVVVQLKPVIRSKQSNNLVQCLGNCGSSITSFCTSSYENVESCNNQSLAYNTVTDPSVSCERILNNGSDKVSVSREQIPLCEVVLEFGSSNSFKETADTNSAIVHKTHQFYKCRCSEIENNEGSAPMAKLECSYSKHCSCKGVDICEMITSVAELKSSSSCFQAEDVKSISIPDLYSSLSYKEPTVCMNPLPVGNGVTNCTLSCEGSVNNGSDASFRSSSKEDENSGDKLSYKRFYSSSFSFGKMSDFEKPSAICGDFSNGMSSGICNNAEVCRSTFSCGTIVSYINKTSVQKISIDEEQTLVSALERERSENLSFKDVDICEKLTSCKVVVELTESGQVGYCENSKFSSPTLCYDGVNNWENVSNVNSGLVRSEASFKCVMNNCIKPVNLSKDETPICEEIVEFDTADDMIPTGSNTNLNFFECSYEKVEACNINECILDANSTDTCENIEVFRPTCTCLRFVCSASKASGEKPVIFQNPSLVGKGVADCTVSCEFLGNNYGDGTDSLSGSKESVNLSIKLSDKKRLSPSFNGRTITVFEKPSSVGKYISDSTSSDICKTAACTPKSFVCSVSKVSDEKIDIDKKLSLDAKLEPSRSQNLSCQDVDIYETLMPVCERVTDSTSIDICNSVEVCGAKSTHENVIVCSVKKTSYEKTENNIEPLTIAKIKHSSREHISLKYVEVSETAAPICTVFLKVSSSRCDLVEAVQSIYPSRESNIHHSLLNQEKPVIFENPSLVGIPLTDCTLSCESLVTNYIGSTDSLSNSDESVNVSIVPSHEKCHSRSFSGEHIVCEKPSPVCKRISDCTLDVCKTGEECRLTIICGSVVCAASKTSSEKINNYAEPPFVTKLERISSENVICKD